MKLYAYQIEALDFINTHKKVIIALDQGLGKTAVASSSILPNERVLVICPATLKLNWKRELQTWANTPEITVIKKKTDTMPDTPGTVIINYDILGKKKNSSIEMNFDFFNFDRIVLDESHYIKNPNAIRSLISAKICLKTPNVVMLTGTPMEKTKHLYMPLKALGSYRGKFHDFGLTFCGAYKKYEFGREIWYYDGASNVKHLRELLQNKMFRRLKHEVIDLPEKIISIVPLDSTRATWERGLSHQTITKNSIPEISKEKLSEYLRMLGEKKTPLAIKHIKMRLETEEKIFIVTRHTKVLDSLMESLRDFNPVKLDGRDSLEQKQYSVDRFQQDPYCRVFIGQINAAGVGITLTAASHVIIVEATWSYSDLMQVIDRCILKGQPILTPQGFRPIEDIKLGDKVINKDGKAVSVVDAWKKQNTKNVVEIDVFGFNETLKTTHDHLFLVNKDWMRAEDLKPGMFLTHPKPLRENKKTEINLDALFTYGYYIGDGFCRKEADYGGFKRFISLSGHRIKKKEHLSRCSRYFHQMGIKRYSDERENCIEDRYYCDNLCVFFENNFGRTCTEKKIPEWVFTDLDSFQRKAFLEGLSASDGYERKGRIEYVSCSKNLCAQIGRLLMLDGVTPCLTQQTKGHWVLSFTLSQVGKRTGYIKKITQRRPKRSEGAREYIYDLTVSEGESFCLGFYVVHNCHRIGQTKTVTAELLTFEDSFDSLMINTCMDKKELINRIVE